MAMILDGLQVLVSARNKKRADDISAVLKALGAEIHEDMQRKNTTHFLFDEGTVHDLDILKTTNEARKDLHIAAVKIVSPRWIEASKKQGSVARESDYFPAELRNDFPHLLIKSSSPVKKREEEIEEVGESKSKSKSKKGKPAAAPPSKSQKNAAAASASATPPGAARVHVKLLQLRLAPQRPPHRPLPPRAARDSRAQLRGTAARAAQPRGAGGQKAQE